MVQMDGTSVGREEIVEMGAPHNSNDSLVELQMGQWMQACHNIGVASIVNLCGTKCTSRYPTGPNLSCELKLQGCFRFLKKKKNGVVSTTNVLRDLLPQRCLLSLQSACYIMRYISYGKT